MMSKLFRGVALILLFGITAAANAIPIPAPANAIPIVGQFSGTWDQPPGFAGTVEMTITSQISTGVDASRFVGFFDWTCVVGPFPCSGRELFEGTLVGDQFAATGAQLVNGVNLLLSTYIATVAPDGSSVTGTFPGGTWGVSRSVPEPTTLTLLGAGLLGLVFVRRKKAA